MLTRYASNRALPPRRKNASSVSRSDGTPGKPGWSGNSNGIYSDPERGTVHHRPGENDVDSSDEGIASHDTAPNDFDSDESIDSPSSQPRDIQRPRRSPLRSSWVSASSMMSTTDPPPPAVAPADSVPARGRSVRTSAPPRLRRIPGRRRIHRPTKSVGFSIVQTRVFDVTEADEKPGQLETMPVFLDDQDDGLEALCSSGSFGW